MKESVKRLSMRSGWRSRRGMKLALQGARSGQGTLAKSWKYQMFHLAQRGSDREPVRIIVIWPAWPRHHTVRQYPFVKAVVTGERFDRTREIILVVTLSSWYQRPPASQFATPSFALSDPYLNEQHYFLSCHSHSLRPYWRSLGRFNGVHQTLNSSPAV